MRPHVHCALFLISFAANGCGLFFEEMDAPCATFQVYDETITADPPDAFPGAPFVLHWDQRYLMDDGSDGATFDQMVESLSLRDPVSGEVRVALPDRLVPAPLPAIQSSSIAFSEFTAQTRRPPGSPRRRSFPSARASSSG